MISTKKSPKAREIKIFVNGFERAGRDRDLNIFIERHRL